MSPRKRRKAGASGASANPPPHGPAVAEEAAALAIPGHNPLTAGRLALLALTFALWTAILEFIPVFLAPYGRIAVRLPRDFAWMIPLGDVVLFGVVAVVALAVSVAWPRARSRTVAVGIFAALTTLAAGSMVERLHPLALLLLAVGVGSAAGRKAARPRRSGRLLPVMAAVATLVVGGINARVEVQEAAWENQWRGWLPIAHSGSSNIVLVILDTVRGASMGFLPDAGPQSPWPAASTPVLDSLATRSVVFTRAMAPSPWTLPSHASMFTGQWPTTLWGASGRGAEWLQGFDGRYPTVAEVLARKGYITGGFVGNLAFTPWETGLSRGFLAYRDYPRTLGQVLLTTTLGRRLEVSGIWRNPLKYHELLNRKDAPAVVDGFLEWREAEGDRPYFAFLNFFDAHEPVFPPDSVKEALPSGSRWDRFRHFAGLLTGNGALRAEKWAMDPAEQGAHAAAYNDGIRRLDTELGRLLRELESRPSRNPTVVIITSDHGEQLGERGLYDHNNSLYLPALHVPLMILAPGAPEGRRVDQVVSLRDVGATILALAGFEPSASGLGGASLTRFWAGSRPADSVDAGPAVHPEPAFAVLSRGSENQPWYPVSWGPEMYALVDSTYQYILNGDGSEELYHLPSDPAQARNVVDEAAHAPARDRFRQAMAQRVDGLPAPRGAVEHPGPPTPP